MILRALTYVGLVSLFSLVACREDNINNQPEEEVPPTTPTSLGDLSDYDNDLQNTFVIEGSFKWEELAFTVAVGSTGVDYAPYVLVNDTLIAMSATGNTQQYLYDGADGDTLVDEAPIFLWNAGLNPSSLEFDLISINVSEQFVYGWELFSVDCGDDTGTCTVTLDGTVTNEDYRTPQ